MLDDRQKKIIFAIFFIITSIGFGYILYRMMFPSNGTPVPVVGQESLNGGLTSAGNSVPSTSTASTQQPGTLQPSTSSIREAEISTKTTVLNDAETKYVSTGANGTTVRYYNPDDGRFYRVKSDGTTETMSDRQFFNVAATSWGNTTDKSIMTFDGGKHGYYNFDTNQYVPLPDYWQNFRFAPGDEQIAAKSIGVDTDNRFLITSKPDGTELRAINGIGENADLVHVNWTANSQIVAWAETGEPTSNGQQILMVGLHKENFKGLQAPGQGFQPLWSPSGKTVLFSVWNAETQNKPDLWISSGEPTSMGAGRRNLHLETWADKCTWGSDTIIFCAVPQELPDNSGIDRSIANGLSDYIYKVDVSAGSITKISTPSQNRSVVNPVVSKDMKKFSFTDATNNKLYQYELP